ncbi:C-C motif chemokine 19-like [Protopterus annectens]|uniref:C-C motif chemokine 19-like n=1 Tax=Protopterus annectens TaxID=7888 RepID=UPI001CFB1835|nr:C-C motif chemokine 19-like [Protopterus annectens]
MRPQKCVLLLSITIIWTFCQDIVRGNNAIDCCLSVSNTTANPRIVKTFRMQTTADGCKIPAVQFITHKRRTLCAPPDENWVHILIGKLKKLCKKRKRAC